MENFGPWVEDSNPERFEVKEVGKLVEITWKGDTMITVDERFHKVNLGRLIELLKNVKERILQS